MDYAVRFVASCSSYSLPGLSAIWRWGAMEVLPLWIPAPLFPAQCRFVENDNAGRDIGLFQILAITSQADMMACFGESTHFHKRDGS